MISMIVLLAGLPGTGKTTLACELATRASGRVLNKDEVRHAIFTDSEIEYSSRQDDFCVELMLQTAAFLLQHRPGRFIFLDGRPFCRRYQIETVLAFSASLHQPWKILECTCSEQTAKQRLNSQITKRVHPAANRDQQLYEEVRSRFEAITLPKTVINTDQPLALCVEQALSSLG